ncbi:predicted protein [Lichtheimia corymbifera JMRC:FSU:9682]|uniref:PHD-type domain-containing protein n=1 Tax=Lichtheimia corymbifera JMRC:FSU:9682 TaxID=1263082 RepID=A0A068RFY3_9FUNG|nr:predicted protein [Lichtheimia corymbifera JMRC:FSU:9682]
MSNNSSSTFQQHVPNSSNANDTNGMDRQRHRMPPIVVNNLNGSRSSNGSPHASPRPINRPVPSPSILPTTSIPAVGQYLPITTSLPQGMQQVIPLHPPMWGDLLPLFALQRSVGSTSSQSTTRTASVAPSTSPAPAPVTTSKPQSRTPQPQSPTTSSASHQSAMHNEISVTQANETTDNGNIGIPPEQPAPTTNKTSDDHRTTNHQSTPETQASNTSTKNSSSPKQMGLVKGGVVQADGNTLRISKTLGDLGPFFLNCVPLQQVRAKYGLSTIDNMENQHDASAQMNVDNADIDMDVGMENAVNEEDGTITNSATDNVVHEKPYGDVDTSMQENDGGQQQPANSVEEEQQPATSMYQKEPESSMDQQQQQPESSMDQQQQQPENSMDQHDTDMTPVTERRLRDADIDPMDIEAWTNHWKEYDPEYCCICIKHNLSPENKLVYCSNPLCEVVVHQACYGIDEIPSADEPWYCDRCEESRNDLKVVCCAVCPSTRGAFRRLKVPLGGMEWIHVGCAVRLPQAHFGDPKMKKEIELPGYLSDMWQGHCELCSNELSARYGGYTTCAQTSCNARAHPSCATQFYHTRKQRVPSFRCSHHRSLSVTSQLEYNPWELWVNKRDDWLQRHESFGFVHHAWSSVMEPVYCNDRPSPNMIEESSKQFVGIISQHLVGFMKKELRNVDRARSCADRLKRRLCSVRVKASKVCKHVDKVQRRVKRVTFLRDKIRQYSIDIRGFMEMVLLQLDATRSKQKALESEADAKRASSSTQPSRGQKRSLSAESYTTANDQPVSSPITPPTTEIEKKPIDKGKGKGKAVAGNIPKTPQTSADVPSTSDKLPNLQRPLKKRSKIYPTQQPTQKPATTLGKPNKAETTAMEIETSPQPQPQPAAAAATTIDKPTTPEMAFVEVETPLASSSSSPTINEAAKATSEGVEVKKADESTKSSVQQKEAFIEEDIDKSIQETQASMATTTTTTTTATSEEEKQQQKPSIEQPIEPGTKASVPIVIDEPDFDVEMPLAPAVEKPSSPPATTSMVTTEEPASPPPAAVSMTTTTVEKSVSPPPVTTTTVEEQAPSPPATTTTVEKSVSPPPATTTTVEEPASSPPTTTATVEEPVSPPPATTTTVEEPVSPPPATTTTVEEPASSPPATTTTVEEPAKTAAEQPKKDSKQRKASRKRGMKARGAKRQGEAKDTRDSSRKPGSKWWTWVEEYTKELRQREKTRGPLVCKECGQHNIPESTLADLRYNPAELANPSEKPYGYTGTGDHWNPSVFIECIGCKDVYHCGCSAIPVKKYPSKNESFFCEDCLESFEANKTYKRVGYGLDDRVPQGPRRRERINYKE